MELSKPTKKITPFTETTSIAEKRAYIMEMERQILQLQQVEPPVKHHFAPGNYAREMFIPAGVVLTGGIHKYAHLTILAMGKILIATEDGVVEMQAPQTFVSPPGVKRVGLALTDTVWITIHPTEETDIKKIEEDVIAPNFEALDAFMNERLEEGQKICRTM